MCKKKETRKKVGKILLKILLAIIILMVISFTIIGILNVVTTKANMELASSFKPVENESIILPQQDENGDYYYVADRDLKVLQLTDIHIGGGCFSSKKDAMALNAVAAMVTAEKPDLIVITGDLTYAVPLFSGTPNNITPAKILTTLLEKLGVPWVPVFGNHDSELYSFYDREYVANFYENDELEHCLFRKGPEEINGYGNAIIPVKNADGITTQALFLLDSNSYLPEDFFGLLWRYDNIHQDQIDWYKTNAQAISDQNKNLIAKLYAGDSEKYNDAMEKYGDVTQLLFFHIPVAEYEQAWNAHIAGDENVNVHYGTVGEKGGFISEPLNEDDVFETIKSFGGTKGIFCGHDHLNNFSLDYDGVRLTYGNSIDYLAYIGISKIGSQRGCTVITLPTEGGFDCYGENYYQDKYVMQSDYTKEPVTMQDMEKAGQKPAEK